MEGVADVLASSLEEERQAVFGFLFTFFDEVGSLSNSILPARAPATTSI